MTQFVDAVPNSSPTLRQLAVDWRQRARKFWEEASPRKRMGIQVGVLLAAVLVAYNYSLLTLFQEADLETPLAYVGLVPAIALALAAVRARPMRPEPPIHDRQIDYIVGIPLLTAVIAANAYLPGKFSVMYWVWRIDLLTLPFFVAGAVAIIFGVRVLWRQKLAVGYLFLAWPYPYQSLLLRILDAFTNGTVAATKHALHYLKVAKAVPAPDGATLFLVTHHGSTFPLSVVSACSGVNSCVGFLLVGSAFGAIVRGPIMRKLAWLTGGMVLLWALNIFRILFVFWAGETWGEHIAIGILHPFIGMVTFSIGVLAMMFLIEPLGMSLGVVSRRHEVPVRMPSRYRQVVAVPRIYAATSIVIVTALLLGIANLGLKNDNLVADISGGPNLTSFIISPAAPSGWGLRRIAEYDWAQPLFGDTSQWFRYDLFHEEGGNLITSTPVIADVIVTPYLSSFSAYGIEACYQFHGYSLKNVAQVSIAGGIVGQTMTYTSVQYGSWTIIYWIIPVKDNGATEYQRTVLYIQNSGGVQVASDDGPVPGVSNEAGSLKAPWNPQLISDRNFLVDFARELVKTEAHQPLFQEPTAALPARHQAPPTPSSTKAPAVNPAVSLTND